jgi:hypothetical protein
MRLLKAYLEDSEVVCGCGEKELRKNKKKWEWKKDKKHRGCF